MNKLPMTIAAAAALMCGTAAVAQMKPAPKATTKPMVAKPMTAPAKPMMAAKPMAAPAKPMMAAKPKAMAANGRMVTTKTKTGKTITYNCSLAGNKTKAACK